MTRVEVFRRKMDAGRTCLGASITFSDPLVTDAIGNSVDFFWLDMEHSGMTARDVSLHLLACRSREVPGFVRIPDGRTASIKGALDCGADGIIVPQVASSREVEGIISDSRYPPLGRRGFGPRVPSDYGRVGMAEQISRANKDVFVCVQIETREALEAVEDIASLPHLDAVVLGPSDLSVALGAAGERRSPVLLKAITRIVKAGRDHGLYVGSGVGFDLDWAAELLKQGVQWLQVGSDYDYLRLAVSTFTDSLRPGAAGNTPEGVRRG